MKSEALREQRRRLERLAKEFADVAVSAETAGEAHVALAYARTAFALAKALAELEKTLQKTKKWS